MIELYWILAGTLVLSGIILGVYRSLWQIFGYSNTSLFGNPENSSELGVFPTAVIQTGLFLFLSIEQELFSDFFMNQESSVVVMGIAVSIGGLLSLELTMLRHRSDNIRKLIFIGLSDAVIGVIAGGLFENGLDAIEGGILGGLIGLIEVLLRRIKILPGTSGKERVDVFPFWIIAWIGAIGGSIHGNFVFVTGWTVLVFVFWVGMAFMGNNMIPPLVHVIGKFISPLISPILILLRFKTILCNHCFRYTFPLRSKYLCGRRYCEHCQKQVEYTYDHGKVIVTFGDLLPPVEGRVFVFANPDFEQYPQSIDVSEIYIDPKTCKKHLLEKCITYMLHTPPKYGIQSVKVFYVGELDHLGGNLKNVLRNNFEHIEEFHLNTQRDLQSAVSERSQSIILPIQEEAQSQLPEGKDAFENASFRQVSTQTTYPPSWRKVASALGGGILGALLGWLSFRLLAIIFAEMENSIVLESQVPIGTFAIVWIVLVTLTGIRKGVQKPLEFAGAAIPLIFILLFAVIIITNILVAISKSKQSRTVTEMRTIGTALGSYQVDSNYFPSTSDIKIQMSEKEGIGKWLCDEGYYCGSLQDGWQQSFTYVSDGTAYTLMSYGKDKRLGSKSEFGSDIVYINGRFTAPSALAQ